MRAQARLRGPGGRLEGRIRSLFERGYRIFGEWALPRPRGAPGSSRGSLPSGLVLSGLRGGLGCAFGNGTRLLPLRQAAPSRDDGFKHRAAEAQFSRLLPRALQPAIRAGSILRLQLAGARPGEAKDRAERRTLEEGPARSASGVGGFHGHPVAAALLGPLECAIGGLYHVHGAHEIGVARDTRRESEGEDLFLVAV